MSRATRTDGGKPPGRLPDRRRMRLPECGLDLRDSATVPDVHNLADLLRRHAADRGDRPALRSPDRVLTWTELDAQVDAVAADLARLAGGAPVAIALPNGIDFAVAYLAALRAGLVVVPINPSYTGRELTQVVTDSLAGVFIATDAVRQAAGTTAARQYDVKKLDPVEPVETAAGGEDLAVLLFTSGTSGAPKGAMLSHRALLANHAQLAQLDPSPVTPDDVVLLALPLFHAYGLNSGLGAVVYHGACGVLLDHFDPTTSLETILANRVTAVVGVPSMFVAWTAHTEQLAHAWSSVRLAVCGAAPLPPDVAARFTQATGATVHQGYGLTETAPVLTSTLVSETVKPGSIGR